MKSVILATAVALGLTACTTTDMADDRMVDTVQLTDSITDLVVGTPELSTLAAAVKAAGLAETLDDSAAAYTVFAPTNTAFLALAPGTLDSLLLPENKETLTNLLMYHVVKGRVQASDITPGMNPVTLSGGSVLFNQDGNTVRLNDATVVQTDILASNGIVHLIDGVLIEAP